MYGGPKFLSPKLRKKLELSNSHKICMKLKISGQKLDSNV